MLKEMIAVADRARYKAYVPFSHFHVGTCLRSPDNKLFAGCNYEDPSFSLSLCAETSAIAHLITSGYQKIAEMVIVTDLSEACPPCGACRQRLYNLAIPKMQIHLCDNASVVRRSYYIEQLLPEAFTFN